MTLRDIARLRQIGGFDPSYLHIERDGPDIATREVYSKSPGLRGASFSGFGA